MGLQLVVYLTGFSVEADTPPEYRGDAAYLAGEYVGKNLFLIAAILFWMGVYRVGRKIKKKERGELLRSFDEPS
jgi:hypothetical protein